MWRVLIQLPSLISEVIGHLRTISYLQQQTLLLQQETNQLLREMIVKVTTQRVETPHAVVLDKPPAPTLNDLPLGRRPGGHAAGEPVSRKLTEHDIVRNTRSSIAADQFEAEGRRQFPHRTQETHPQMPTSPHKSPTLENPTPPLGPPPQV